MSIRIDCNKKEILHVKNSIFGTLHEAITNIIEERDLPISSDIERLLMKTDQTTYGTGAVTADIANYLKEKKDVLVFADLVRQAIENEYADFNRFIGCIDHLWDFYNKLLEYANQLPDK